MSCAKIKVFRIYRANKGQATVEAAFLIPVLCCMLLLLLQPGIILYDRLVMQAAASDACRLLVTATDAAGSMDESAEAFVRHRLGAIPPLAIFHLHEGGCSWDIQLIGDESSDQVSVKIKNEIRPLPFIDVAGTLLGLTNDQGHLEVQVEQSAATQPGWARGTSAGNNPSAWIGAWL